MFYLPKKTDFGKLEIKEIFEFYDVPRLFVCKNKTGQHYLVLSIDENEEELIWLYLSVSPDRLHSLISGHIELHFAFTNPENDFLYKVKTKFSSDYTQLERISPQQLTEDELPYKNTYLANKSINNYTLGEINPKDSALSSRREVCNLHLYPDNSLGVEFSIKKLAKVLNSFQDVVDAIGQKCSGRPTTKGSIPLGILQQTSLNACQIFSGSFGFQVKSNYVDDYVLNASLISDTLSELLELFMIKDNEAELEIKLCDLKWRTALKYKQLLKELLNIESDFKIEWGSPINERGGDIFLEKQVIKKTFDIINRLDISEEIEIIHIKGKLAGFDTVKKVYHIISEEEDKMFSGKISDNVEIQSEIIIHENYHAEIEKTIEYQTFSEEKTKWKLIKLTR